MDLTEFSKRGARARWSKTTKEQRKEALKKAHEARKESARMRRWQKSQGTADK
jgi:hypothetical protein